MKSMRGLTYKTNPSHQRHEPILKRPLRCIEKKQAVDGTLENPEAIPAIR